MAPRPDDDRQTSERLRKEIDSGAGGDKIPFPDPAAVPLGADDEAGGSPPTREQIAMARAHETRGVNPIGPGATDESARAGAPAQWGHFFWLWPMAAVTAAILAVVALVLS